MRKIAFLLMAGIALAGATSAHAQITASINIPTVLSIDVDGVTTFAFPAVTAGNYDATGTGVVGAGAGNNSTLSTRGNVAHAVEIVSSGYVTEMVYAGTDPTAPGKPVSDLQWSLDGSAWTSLQATEQDVLTGLARGAHQNEAVVQYQMLLDLETDAPGTYDVTFVYSVVAN